jgi:peroxiredoxin
LPSLQSLKQRYQGKPFKVLLVNVQEQVETVKQLFKKEQIALQVVFDQDGKVSKNYHVSNHPVKFLIDEQGNMMAMGLGYRDWDSEEMNKLVNILIQQAGEIPKA